MELDDGVIESSKEEYQPLWLSNPRDFEDRRALEAAHLNTLLAKHLDPSVEAWECDSVGWTFEFGYCSISVDTDEIALLRIRALSDVMPRKYLDPMRMALREIILGSIHLNWATHEIAITLLQAVEEVVCWKDLWHAQLTEHLVSKGTRVVNPFQLKKHTQGSDRLLSQGFDARAIRGYNSVLDNPSGVNLRSIKDTEIDLLGEDIETICGGISKDLRILHVEPVTRNDLVSNFWAQQRKMHDQLRKLSYAKLRQSVSPTVISRNSVEDTREGLAKELSMPTYTFHGAQRRSIESIVRYGFIIPGEEIGHTGKTTNVRCGSTYGKGIYSSPDSSYASAYLDYQRGENMGFAQPSDIPGMRLIVCATLMGRPMQVHSGSARGSQAVLNSEAHSHVSPNGFEYIVFSSAQIIPCYVLHLDYGAERAREEFEKIAANPTQFFQRRRKAKQDDKRNEWDRWYYSEPGENETRQAALKAAAQKWFPHGFGPAQGTSFVIEDMAEHSDDEELYGDFQHQRIEEENETHRNGAASSRNWFDEYQLVRKSNRDLALWDG